MPLPLPKPKHKKPPSYYIHNPVYQMGKLDDAEHIIMPDAAKALKKNERVIIYKVGY
jgi:hypothetical protein